MSKKELIDGERLTYHISALKKRQSYEFSISASTSVGEGPTTAIATQILQNKGSNIHSDALL